MTCALFNFILCVSRILEPKFRSYFIDSFKSSDLRLWRRSELLKESINIFKSRNLIKKVSRALCVLHKKVKILENFNFLCKNAQGSRNFFKFLDYGRSRSLRARTP